MRRALIVLVVLAAGCAAAKAGWSPALRFGVYDWCVNATSGQKPYCVCFAQALEKASPAPEGDITREELQAATSACADKLQTREPLQGEGRADL